MVSGLVSLSIIMLNLYMKKETVGVSTTTTELLSHIGFAKTIPGVDAQIVQSLITSWKMEEIFFWGECVHMGIQIFK